MRPATLFALTCALFGGLAAFGCFDELGSNDQESTFVSTEIAGSVSIPLVANAADGSTYRLRSATFDISGSAMVTIASRDSEPREALTTALPPGDYSLYLRPGFRVVEIKPDGSEVPADASLVSSNPAHFEIGQMSDARLKLRFKSGDKELAFGDGVPVHVTEVNSDSL